MKNYTVAFAGTIMVFFVVIAIFYKVMFDFQQKRVAEAKAEIKANQKALDASETYTKQTIIIREKGNAATVRIKEAPQADTPVPDDVLSAWSDGIDRLRGTDAKPGAATVVP